MKFAEAVSRLRGPFSAIFTPFDARNQVNFEMLSRMAEFQLANGICGFFVCGSTGEGLLLSFDERVSVVSHLVEHFGSRAVVIAHVGHPSTDVAGQLAVQSQRVGAHWIASVGPIYHGTTFPGTLRHYQQIATATDLPFMIYSIGSEIVPERDRELFSIGNVCGMKYTGANFYSVQQLARQVDRPVAWMSGFDEQFVAGQLFGFQGGIGTTFNFAPEFYSGIFQLVQQEKMNEAAARQAEINKVTYLMASFENRSYHKAIMRYIGLDCGPCRAPYAALTDAEYESFVKKLDALGVLKRDGATGVKNETATNPRNQN